MRQLALALLAACALAAAAGAQSVNVVLASPPVVPAAPTADQPVHASVHVVSCADIPIAVERLGSTINLRYVNVTGAERTYERPLGVPFPPITDTNAFACS